MDLIDYNDIGHDSYLGREYSMAVGSAHYRRLSRLAAGNSENMQMFFCIFLFTDVHSADT